MGRTTYDAFRYSKTVVLVVGILGNILVIISILRQKIVLKNNYYFLVRHLAMCDVGVLIIYLFDCINIYFVEQQLDINSTMYCGRRNAPGTSFNILKFIRNRRIFFVCFITVLCYAVGNIPMTVHLILNIAEKHRFMLMKYVWLCIWQTL